jgi:hypothetical protein
MESRRFLSALFGVFSLSVPSMLGCSAEGGSSPYGSVPSTTPPATPPSELSLTPEGRARPSSLPAVSGGTLLVMQDGNTTVAADSDRDVVWVVDLAGRKLLHEVSLHSGDEPGRAAEDTAGRVHVLLRSGGALVSIDPLKGTILARRAVCPAPRGLAYDAGRDALHVACADGRLFTFPSGGGGATGVVQLDGDLRDVIMQGSDVYVTTFRSAEILQVGEHGTIAQRITLPPSTSFALPGGPGGPAPGPPTPPDSLTFQPEVAWRTIAMPGGGLAVLHQRGQEEAVSTQPGGYTGGIGCPGTGIVQDAVTFVPPGGGVLVAPSLGMMALAVDVAVSADGSQIAVASASSQQSPTTTSVGVYPVSSLQSGASCVSPPVPLDTSRQVTAVAFDGQGNVIAQSREPAGIIVGDITIALPGASVANDGHDIFHAATQAGIACMSCHPEAGDDGRVWLFDSLGPRRTQNIRGGVLARAPFHWSGDIPNMTTLVQVVLVGRMGGSPLLPPQIDALGAWMDAQPALTAPAPVDPAAVARGQQTFEDPAVGCATCHSGPQLSDHQLVDVGTGETPGEPFKVPSLIAVGYRAPYLHNGCAATLHDRFSPACDSGNQHGTIQQLNGDQIDDLVSYLQSL